MTMYTRIYLYSRNRISCYMAPPSDVQIWRRANSYWEARPSSRLRFGGDAGVTGLPKCGLRWSIDTVSYRPPILIMKNFTARLWTAYGPRKDGESDGADGGAFTYTNSADLSSGGGEGAELLLSAPRG
jgi:hypothetical protein